MAERARWALPEPYGWATQQRLEALLMEGIESGPAREMTAADWEELRRRVWQRHAERGGK